MPSGNPLRSVAETVIGGVVLLVVAGAVSATAGGVKSTVTRNGCDAGLVTPLNVSVAVNDAVPSGKVVPV